MTTTDHRLIMIVRAADRAQANVDAQLAVPGCGLDNFSAALVPRGSAPGASPTHYACSWQMSEAQVAALMERFGGGASGRIVRRGIALVTPRTVNGEVERTTQEVLNEFGLEPLVHPVPDRSDPVASP